MVDPVLSLASEYEHILAPPGEWICGVRKARVLYGWAGRDSALHLCAPGLYIELWVHLGWPLYRNGCMATIPDRHMLGQF